MAANSLRRLAVTVAACQPAPATWAQCASCIPSAAFNSSTLQAAAQPQALDLGEASPQPQTSSTYQPQARAAAHRIRRPLSPLDFNDAAAAYQAKSTGQLLTSYAVFSACQFRPLVQYADTLLDWSQKTLGNRITNAVVRNTFFKHFCAGEDQEGIKPVLRTLHRSGIGSILDYAAEDDVSTEGRPASRTAPNDTVIARTYDYDSEAKCDRHMAVFLRAIEAAAESPGQGFAAIKATALGQPRLLERVSDNLRAIKSLFAQFDEDRSGTITREEFSKVYIELFNDSTPQRIQKLFRYLDCDHTGMVDYLSWSRRVKLEDVPKVVLACRQAGPLSASALTAEELELLGNMMHRLHTLATAAAQSNVKLMVDAEHTYFQPAIDHAAMELQRIHNKQEAVIFNTYQCYLRDAHERLVMDMDRARREGFKFGAKLVRGAYMHLERERAEEKGYPSPILDNIEQTHANYNRSMEELLERVASQGAEFMVASHNQASVEQAVAGVNARGLDPTTCGVYFGQLLGMADNLTFILGGNGYRAYKYVPFGPVDEVIPYLVRRAQENSDVMGGVGKEKAMLRTELWRRFTRSPAAKQRQQHA